MTASPPPEPPAPPARRLPLRRLAPWLAAIALTGLALRAWEASEASLWLDELHTLFHANLPGLGAVRESVAREMHTPLFFLAVHLLGGWEEGEWLRVLPAVTSLVALVPLAAIASRASAGARAALLAAWLFACLPYQVYYSAMLRPYAWAGLFSAAAAWAAFTDRGSRPARAVLFFLFVFFGIASHRLMVVSVLAIGMARLFVRDRRMLELRWLILAGALAAAPTLPWLFQFAGHATESHLAYRRSADFWGLRPQLLAEIRVLPLRLFVPHIATLGRPWNLAAAAGAAVFFAAGALALALWARERWRGRAPALHPTLRAAVLFGLFDLALILALSVWAWDRAPLQYYAGMAWTLPLALAAAATALPSPAMQRALALALALSALALGAAQAGGKAEEDFRRAVATAREIGRELEEGGRAPFFTALLAQPSEVFPHGLPYQAYAPDLGAIEPSQVPVAGEAGFERPVVVVWRLVPWDRPSWQRLAAGRRLERDVKIDERVSVFLLEPQE